MGDNAGLITYGAIDNINCHSKAISDTGTSWLGAPLSIVNAVANLTDAQYDPDYEIYIVDCATGDTQPDLVFTINGVKYHVPPQKYIFKFASNPEKCAIALFSTKSGGFGPAWILGNTWIRSFCNIYDIGQKRTGFAEAIHSKI
ncbi:Inositol hexakisphosphate and diphosphoinositol-pentakisphosphate kinase [Parelaphostrongylus tenuis]|uniref:Inositol hexakisphosphate and diphosphoinositol-pentakisphosphate kinase n=1 Tax=Parelaphostrongylus tenuis TaxID=148309 RepID=A0AAD5R1E1_PARTN|nr:Inositol hexakisphosphate and diphosphoinositol-pentakisphosphate kinase [Parelaphostrongylus tenuis]